ESHSFYGNGFRQHNSVPAEIFALVVQGFAIVASDPVKKIKESARIRKMKKLGLWNKDLDRSYKERYEANQIVYAGTAGYHFQHFYKYFKKWHAIVESKGNIDKLKETFGEDI